MSKKCRDGGTGRHVALKMLFANASEGSIPSPDTTAILFYINLKKERKIMEIVYFVLGVVTVLLVLGVVVVVRIGTLVKELKEEVQFLERGSNDVADGVHRRIDDEVRELQTQFKDALNFIGDTKDVLHKRIDEVENDVYRKVDEVENYLEKQLDSRLDKLENKIKQKDLLKG